MNEEQKFYRLMKKIELVLSPSLLTPEWRKKIRPGDDFLKGFCYVVTEAVWYLWGKRNGFKPRRVIFEGNAHWYLKDPYTEQILDPTASQFGGREAYFCKDVPYANGKGAMFPSYPHKSNRCKELIRRIEVL
jgi:hypothetical protein